MQQCALTGGIGSGKSTLADALEGEGFPVLRADRLSAEAIAPGSPGLAAVVAHFGQDILSEDGRLDRKGLGDIIFADATQKRALEAIVHPKVQELYTQKLHGLRASGSDLMFYEIPLLVETQRAQAFDAVVAITAPRQRRIERVVRRSGLTPEQVQARLANQASDFQRICIADFVLHNDGTLACLQKQIRPLLDELKARLAYKARLPYRGQLNS